MLRKTVLVVFLFLMGAGSCWGEEGSGKSGLSPDQPIQITSDRLEGDDKAGRVNFLGNVVARQADVSIYAEEMAIFFQAGGRDFERVEAYRGVRIVQGNRVATGDKAIYYNLEGKVILTGSPKVHQGKDMVEGDEITVFLNEEKSIVKGREGARVNAIFHPQRKEP